MKHGTQQPAICSAQQECLPGACRAAVVLFWWDSSNLRSNARRAAEALCPATATFAHDEAGSPLVFHSSAFSSFSVLFFLYFFFRNPRLFVLLSSFLFFTRVFEIREQTSPPGRPGEGGGVPLRTLTSTCGSIQCCCHFRSGKNR